MTEKAPEISTTHVDPQTLNELKMYELKLRAHRAEHALTAERLAALEKETQGFLDRMSAELSEGGRYELISGVDVNTGAVQRKLVKPEAVEPATTESARTNGAA